MSDTLAAQMGTFAEWNWTRPQLMYMLKELARGLEPDEGNEFGGLCGVMGLNIAIAANEGRSAKDAIAATLHHIRCLAALLTRDAPTAEQRTAMRAILAATDEWTY